MLIAFNEVGVISGVQGGPNFRSNPTSLRTGPDGRVNDSNNAFTLSIPGGEYIATNNEWLVEGDGNEIVKSFRNHNVDGSSKPLLEQAALRNRRRQLLRGP